jgi:cytochrome c oxidase cbb3-type subunit 3
MKKETPKNNNDSEVILLEHEYDGIQEYDQRLPNWWLITLWGAVIFSLLYWFFYFQSRVGMTDIELLEQRLERIEAANLEATLAMLDDGNLWQMSRNAQFIQAGRNHYTAHCSACHGPNLEGGIGFALVDNDWVHGSAPTDIFRVVDEGIPGTGMQAWGGSLGPKRIAEVVAYVLSYHEQP